MRGKNVDVGNGGEGRADVAAEPCQQIPARPTRTQPENTRSFNRLFEPRVRGVPKTMPRGLRINPFDARELGASGPRKDGKAQSKRRSNW
jgi:hypothetical protein